jgi:predicted alpha/beta superfamily hydrolase
MLKPILATAATILTASLMAQYNVSIKINSLPKYHSSGNDIYLAGSFNGWNAADTNYRFQKDGKGNYFIEFSLAEGIYEYKLTRGGWDKVECKKDRESIDNRLLKVEAGVSQTINVQEWIDRFPPQPKTSTASKNVQIVDMAFFIPQLKRTRRVWIYLPENYKKSTKHFPVLYMQDGQNVFDEATAYAGEWGVDEYFDSLYHKGIESIVVAVDNGGAKRMNEYSPYSTTKFGKGEGSTYVDFIVKTLKPFIDKHYRTLKDKENTSIAGSSMGGLISFYALLKYPKVFGGAGILSPSLWVSPKIFDAIKAKGKNVNSKIYFYAGKLEDERMVQNMLKAFELMGKYSKSTITAVIRDDGKHNEATWRREFPLFYEWMIK